MMRDGRERLLVHGDCYAGGVDESNRLKKEACDNCADQLRNILSVEQLREFAEAFYSVAAGYVFKRKK